MIRNLLFSLTFVILTFLPSAVNAQATQPDTSFLRHSIVNAAQIYSNAVDQHTHLYSGTEYYNQSKPYLKGHEFFIEKTLEKGKVFYDGSWFSEVPLLYDLVLDEVVTTHQGNGFLLKLVKQKVDTFQLRGHTFVYINTDSTTAESMRPGFYDVLYNGKVKALAKREKNVQERTSVNGMEGSYNTVERFYIWKDGSYYQVGSKGSVLKVLRDEKKELQKFARANKLKFRSQREESILKITQYYDTLKEN